MLQDTISCSSSSQTYPALPLRSVTLLNPCNVQAHKHQNIIKLRICGRVGFNEWWATDTSIMSPYVPCTDGMLGEEQVSPQKWILTDNCVERGFLSSQPCLV